MKYVKMLGLVAIAAAALMAFVGASTASATVLCKTNPTAGVGETTGTVCPEGWAYGGGTEIHAVLDPGVKAVLTSNEAFKPNVECEESTVLGKTENEGNATETVTGKVEAKNLTWGKCNCEVKTLKGGTLEVHWIEKSHNGTMTSNGAEVTTVCPSAFGNIHCIYVTEADDLGTLTGGNPATMDIESHAMKQLKTDSLCPASPTWDAKYEITSPKPLYVSAHT